MFTGIGGFEYGIEKAYNNKYESEKSGSTDIESRGVGNINQRERSFLFTNNPPLCVGFSEIDKYAIQIYKQHYPNHKNYGSATEINPEELPNFDMLCGGFPCQAFSIAGKRMGFEDTRGTLFFDIARIAKVKRPRFLFLENVKGLLNHDNGRTFTTILATLDELGYNAEWEVLNSKYFGVPQNRERVFIIGHLRGTSSRQIFPLGKSSRNINKTQQITTNVLALDLYNKKAHSDRTPALTEPHHNSLRMMVNNKIRKLTPTECERLQGFPDGWTEGVSDTQRYKCLGNAVTVNVIEAIASQMQLKGRSVKE